MSATETGSARRTARSGARPKQRAAQIAASVDGFRRVLRALRLAERDTQHSTGLSAAQHFVLSVIDESPALSVNGLAELTMTDRSSVAAVLDRLVASGLAVRSSANDDRRRAVVTITPAGRAALRKGSRPPTSVLVAGLEELSATQLSHLATSLGALTRAMGIAGDPATMLFEDQPARRPKVVTRG